MIDWLQAKLSTIPKILSMVPKAFHYDLAEADGAANDPVYKPAKTFIEEIEYAKRSRIKVFDRQRLDSSKILSFKDIEVAVIQNAYTHRKCILPLGAFQQGDDLLLPIWNLQGDLINIQFILSDGRKSLLKKRCSYPGYISVCEGSGTRLVICQDWETASTLSEYYPGYWIVSAQRPEQLLLLAAGFRSAYPKAEIIIASSDDRCKEGNPGLARANQAAELIGAEVIKPEWPENAPKRLRTFNDLHIWLIQRNSYN